MRRVVGCVLAALAAGLSAYGVGVALAEGDGEAAASLEKLPEPDEESDEKPEEESVLARRFLLFSGGDLWRNGGFSHGGFLWAHQGLNADGPVLKVLLNGGLYRFRSGKREIVGQQMMASALPGWRWHRPGFEVTVYAGVDVQDHRFTRNEPNRLRGTKVGARGGFDVWYEPFANVMVTGSASLSTVGSSYWTRAATGVRLFDAIWVGPEALASGDETYRQLRFGAHLTSLRFRAYEFAVGGGWATDSDGRDGAYGRFGIIWRPSSGGPLPEEGVPF